MGSSGTRSRGARTEPSTGAIWVRPVAPQAEFRGERFRDIGLQPLCNHGAITRPRIPQDRRTALKDTSGISQVPLPRRRVRRYNKRMFRYKNQGLHFLGPTFFIHRPTHCPLPAAASGSGICRRRQQSDRGGENESIGALWNPSFCVSAGSAGPGEIVIDYGIPIEDTGVVSGGARVSIEPTDLASESSRSGFSRRSITAKS